MDGVNIGALVARVRAMGMEVWVEDNRVRGKMRGGGKIPLDVRDVAMELRDLGQIAVDYLAREARGEIAPVAAGEPARANVAGDAPPWDDQPARRPVAGTLAAVMPEPDAGGWVVLEGVKPEVAFAAAKLINAGKAELIGMVIYRKLSDTFDLTYKLLEATA